MTDPILYWPAPPEDALHWHQDQGYGSGSLSEAAAALKSKRCILLLGPHCLNTLETELPTRNLAKARLAAPFALEEQLAEDVEALHYALGRPIGQRFAVAVIDMTLMRTIQSAHHDAGLSVKSILPAMLCLPWQEGRWTLYCDASHWWLRSGYGSGYLLPANVALPLLQDLRSQSLDENGQPPPIDSIGPLAPAELEWCEQHEPRALIDCFDAKNAPPEITLLQGPLLPRNHNLSWLRPWRRPAAMAAVLGAIWLGGLFMEYLELNREWDDLQSQQRALFMQTFPDATRIFDPPRQMRARQRALGNTDSNSAGDLLSVLALVARGIGQQSQIVLQNLVLRNGRVEVELQTPSFELLEQARARLSEHSGGEVTIQSTQQNGDAIRGRLRIEGNRA